MATHIRRRELIAALGGATVAWPLVGRAQQPAMPIVGFLGTTTPDDFMDRVAAFREGLKDSGYVEGRNVLVEYRWPEGHYDRLPSLAADLVRRQVAVIAATGGEPSALAAKAATTTIPIVFSIGGDPVRVGLVASLSRPGGTITGVHYFQPDLGAKRLGLLHELLPQATVIGILVNPTFTDAEAEARDATQAATLLGVQTEIVGAHAVDQFSTAFATLAQKKVGGFVMANDAFFFRERHQLLALAARYDMPAIYCWREFALDGGLMSYSPSLTQGYRQVGIYVGRILKGEKPADLPVQRPTKFEFVINLQTAKTLGLTFPPGLLAIADEVIE